MPFMYVYYNLCDCMELYYIISVYIQNLDLRSGFSVSDTYDLNLCPASISGYAHSVRVLIWICRNGDACNPILFVQVKIYRFAVILTVVVIAGVPTALVYIVAFSHIRKNGIFVHADARPNIHVHPREIMGRIILIIGSAAVIIKPVDLTLRDILYLAGRIVEADENSHILISGIGHQIRGGSIPRIQYISLLGIIVGII